MNTHWLCIFAIDGPLIHGATHITSRVVLRVWLVSPENAWGAEAIPLITVQARTIRTQNLEYDKKCAFGRS